MVRSVEIAVVGGGIVGLTAAYELLRRGARGLLVLDHGRLGGEASVAAAGFVSSAAMRARRGVRFELLRRGERKLEEIAQELEHDLGRSVGWSRAGKLELLEERELEEAESRCGKLRGEGVRAEVLERKDLEGLAPGVASRFRWALWFPEGQRVDPRVFLLALRHAVLRMGAEFATDFVRAVEPSRSHVTLRTDAGPLEVGRAVLAAGFRTPDLLRPLGFRLPVRPARGELVAFPRVTELSAVAARGETRIFPQGEELWAGSVVFYDDVIEPSPAIATELRGRASALFPALAEVPLRRHWSGIRPCSAIRRPIVATLPGIPSVVVACGHHRDGFGTAPASAEVVASLLGFGSSSLPVSTVGWPGRAPRGHGRGLPREPGEAKEPR